MSLYDKPAAPRRPVLRGSIIAGLIALLLAGLIWHSRPDGYLHVFFLDVPGDAVLIQSPGGSYVLIDGGEDPVQLALSLGQQLPFWKRTLQAVILTQAGEQRLPGQVAALTRYRAELALAPLPLPPDDISREWVRLLQEQQTPVHAAQPGMRMVLDGAVLTVLAAGTTDDGQKAGVVLGLDYGTTSVVLNNAGNEVTDAALLPGARAITVLAYPWQRELDTPLLAAWQPRAIVFTTAYQAAPPALLTFHDRTMGDPGRYHRLYHPELDGTVEFISNGQAACVRRADEPPCL